MGRAQDCNCLCGPGGGSSTSSSASRRTTSSSASSLSVPAGCPDSLDTCIVMPTKWLVQLTASNGTCSFCSSLASFEVTWTSIYYGLNCTACVWDICQGTPSGCGCNQVSNTCEWEARLTLLNISGTARFNLSIVSGFSASEAVYRSTDPVVCFGTNAISVFSSTSARCTGWGPGTITPA